MDLQFFSDYFHKFFVKVITYEPGNDYSGSGSILRYDAGFLLTWGWWLPFRGSVFRWPVIEVVIVGFAAATGLAYFKCNNYVPTKHVCIPLPVGFSNLTLLTVASFLIGLFANTLLQRWWALRFHMHGHIGTNNEILILVATTLANNPKVKESSSSAAEAKQACYCIYRYLNLGNHLVVMNARKDFDYQVLLNKGLVTPAELSTLQKLSASPNIAYSWIDARIQKLAHAGFLGAGGIAQANLSAMLTAVGTARSNCIAVGVYIDTQLPYPFVQLISFVVNGVIIQAVLVAGGTIGDAFQTKNNDAIVAAYLSLLLFIAVMKALLIVYPVLANPLGDDAGDLPRTSYLNGAERGMLALMNNIFDVSISAEENILLRDYHLDETHAPSLTGLYFPSDKDAKPSTSAVPQRQRRVSILNRGASFFKELAMRQQQKREPRKFSLIKQASIGLMKQASSKIFTEETLIDAEADVPKNSYQKKEAIYAAPSIYSHGMAPNLSDATSSAARNDVNTRAQAPINDSASEPRRNSGVTNGSHDTRMGFRPSLLAAPPPSVTGGTAIVENFADIEDQDEKSEADADSQHAGSYVIGVE